MCTAMYLSETLYSWPIKAALTNPKLEERRIATNLPNLSRPINGSCLKQINSPRRYVSGPVNPFFLLFFSRVSGEINKQTVQ
jgi:hypothetical protein